MIQFETFEKGCSTKIRVFHSRFLGFASSLDGLTRTWGAGGRGNRERDDRSKHLMVDPNPIREPMEETFDKEELAPIIMVQPITPSRQVEVGERSSAEQKKKKKKIKTVPYKFNDEYEIWIKTKVFKDWSDGSYEQRGGTHIVDRLATLEGKAWLVTKVEMWEIWLDVGKVRRVNPRSFSWKMKAVNQYVTTNFVGSRLKPRSRI
ncbi:hypothetical protein R1sor_006606 [Riccia sorocarpa]|uniref:Uncharacterized protein n=1 Tax=Riccia sorocarpa TaxID=122646 RepID=A0ABD3HMX7_9MARC